MSAHLEAGEISGRTMVEKAASIGSNASPMQAQPHDSIPVPNKFAHLPDRRVFSVKC